MKGVPFSMEGIRKGYLFYQKCHIKGLGCSGLVVSALDFRSGGRWFEPGFSRRVVSLDKKLDSTLTLLTQVYKWVPAIIMMG